MKRRIIYTDDVLVDAIVGFRGWKAWVEEGVVRLTSTTRQSFEWLPGQAMQARCKCVLQYDRGHTCGIYSWAHPVIPYSSSTMRGHQIGARQGWSLILGEVDLWGKVKRHERGYRAEWGKPATFYVVEGMNLMQKHFVELAAMQWGIPITLVSQATAGDLL